MDVGMMMVFARYGWDDCSDARVCDEEIRLARLAADLGFASVAAWRDASSPPSASAWTSRASASTRQRR